MIIDDPESFKLWLTAVLEPRCDADPAALAKYVLALVRKDKPIPELRTCMIEQLDVFLANETQEFVEELFRALETQTFCIPNDPSTSCATIPPSGVAPVSQPIDPAATKLPESFPVLPAAEPAGTASVPAVTPASSKRDDIKRKPETAVTTRTAPGARARSRSWERGTRTRGRDYGARRDRQDRSWRNKSPPQRSRHNRRSSWSRSKSPVAARSRSKSPRANRGRYRNRSPPLVNSRSRSHSPGGSHKYRAINGWSKSGSHMHQVTNGWSKSECLMHPARPPDIGGCCLHPAINGWTNSECLNHSARHGYHNSESLMYPATHGCHNFDRGAGGLTKKESVSGGGTPTQDSNHGDVDMRLTTSSQSIQSVVRSKQTLRCRDFDEKGYCMRGDLCPFDHGTDPVVLEDVALGSVLTFAAPTQPVQPAMPVHQPQGRPMLMGPGPRMRPPMHMQILVPHSRGPHAVNMEYNPDAPSMEPRGWGRGGRGGRGARGHHRPMPYNPHHQRELISVPVMEQYPGFERHHPQHQPKEPIKQRMGYEVFGRLGPRFKPTQPASLELKKVPRGLNNITHLNEHFNKFGKIVNIQVQLDGDPEGAIVTFSSHAEANAAYRSTEAVLNNRFIKVFWHNTNNEVKQVQGNASPQRTSVKDRLGVVSNNNHSLDNTAQNAPSVEKPVQEEKVVMSGNTLTKTLYIPTVKKVDNPGAVAQTAIVDSAQMKANNLAAIKNNQDILEAKVTLKRMQIEKQKEAIKLFANLRKRKQDLLDKYLGQQRLLISCLEKLEPGEERRSLMATIKSLQVSIEASKKDIENGVGVTSRAIVKAKLRPKPIMKSKEAAQKELLDLELDLFARQQGGGDTSDLKLRVAELKLMSQMQSPNAQSSGLGTASRRGGFRGRARSFTSAGQSSVDHRPTKLLVSGYENDEKPAVLIHFGQYGEITDYMCDDATPSVILNYKNRKGAEAALVKGRSFQDRLLSITWCSQPGHPAHRNSRMVSNLTHHALSPRDGGSAARMEEEFEADEGEVDEDDETNANMGSSDGNHIRPMRLMSGLSEDALLQDDEDDEDDDEEKTWRR